MNRKECRVTRREIDQSELNQRFSDQTLAHLASCKPCSEFRDERSRLRELFGELKPITAPADFEMRLRARIAEQRHSNGHRPSFFSFAMSTPAIVFAALVVVGVASLVWFTQHNRNQQQTVAFDTSGPVREPNATVNKKTPVVNQDKTLTPGTSATIPDRTSGARVPGRRVAPQDTAQRTGTKSFDIGLQPADSIRKIDRNPGEFSFTAPGKPLVISMQDDRGMTRKFSLPPVSFGSERLVDNRIPVVSSNTRSW